MTPITSSLRISLIAIAAFCLSMIMGRAEAAAIDFANDYRHIRISGNSMLPTLNNGEVTVVYKKYPYKDLRVGDVVIIESERGYSVIHRITRRYRGSLWVTQGDNNAREDREVLSQKNFGGLALIGEATLARYNDHIVAMSASEPVAAMAKASSEASSLR